MSESTPPELRTELWCAGLRLAGTRALASHERAALIRRAELQRRTAQRFVMAGAVLALWPVALAGVRAGDVPWLWAQTALIALVLTGWIVGIPAAGLIAWDLWRARGKHLEDLERGEALCFEGTIAAAEETDEEQKQLFVAGLLALDPDVPQRLDVLPASHTVFYADRRARARFRAVLVHEVAAGPGYAMRVPLPRGVAWVGNTNVRVLRRTLSDSERAEILAHIRRLEQPNGYTLFMTLMLLLSLGILLGFVRAGRLDLLRSYPTVLLQIPVSMLVVAGYLRDLRHAMKLRRDTVTGWALTCERLRDEEASPAEDAAEIEEEPATEFLPHSLTPWSTAGKPARWRDLRKAA